MIDIRDGQNRLAIKWDARVVEYAATSLAMATIPVERRGGGPREATIEMVRGIGGLPQRMLLGGTKTPSAGRELKITVPTTGEFLDTSPLAREGLLRRPLIPGLPDDLAQSVLAGLLEYTTTAGILEVTSAAYDAEQSSYVAAIAAARILAVVLHLEGDELTEKDERRLRRLLNP